MNTVTEVTGTARATSEKPKASKEASVGPECAHVASGKGKVAKRGKPRTLVHAAEPHAKVFLAHINRQQTSNPAASSAFRTPAARMTSGKRTLKRRVSQPFGASLSRRERGVGDRRGSRDPRASKVGVTWSSGTASSSVSLLGCVLTKYPAGKYSRLTALSSIGSGAAFTP